MSLRLKINLIVASVVALLVAAMIGLQIASLRSSVREEVQAANRVATQLLQRVDGVYAPEGLDSLLRFLQRLGRVRANDITLVDGEGRVLYRSPPFTYKQGHEAPAWFSALIVPQISRQVIALPHGYLAIEAEPSRAVLDGWDDLLTLAGGGAAMLLLVNALVFWAMGRALQPFSQIVEGLNRLEGGDFGVVLPPLRGQEASAIGGAFNRMTAVLKDHLAMHRRAYEAERRLSDSRELAGLIEGHIEAERREIARALHDELGQSVTAIRSLAMSVARRCTPSDAQTAQAARVITEEAGRLYDHMHGMIPRLAPMALDSLGLGDALDDLVERVRASQPAVAIDFDPAPLPGGLAAVPALAAYRIAQEGLTNALRHSQARRVRLVVEAEDGFLHIQVQDDGVGPPADWQRPGHFGLRWLSERADALGGELRLAARNEGGAVLEARLPMGPLEPTQQETT
ncbi:ATP-binding protein [Paracidovorax wautersii]|uniref:ATP-binding protein n=1 Tax=Paracidovorax wautersii TaxID=1177982 RepID=UPI0031E1E19E